MAAVQASPEVHEAVSATRSAAIWLLTSLLQLFLFIHFVTCLNYAIGTQERCARVRRVVSGLLQAQ